MTKLQGRKPRLFTVGHSDMSLDTFFGVIDHSSIRLVADIRSNPASARYPHFERYALSAALEKRGISYRWFRKLGGRLPKTPGEDEQTYFEEEGFRRYAAYMNTPEFGDAVEDLLGVVSSTQVVVLCAERDFNNCHRSLLADKLVLLGARVVHIRGDRTAKDHVINPHLIHEDGKILYKNKQIELF